MQLFDEVEVVEVDTDAQVLIHIDEVEVVQVESYVELLVFDEKLIFLFDEVELDE